MMRMYLFTSLKMCLLSKFCTWVLFTCWITCESESPWASGREDYMHIGVFHDAQVVSSIPSVVIGCEPRSGYASVHICLPAHGHFCLLANVSQAAELLSIVYYFLLCIRAVASSPFLLSTDCSWMKLESLWRECSIISWVLVFILLYGVGIENFFFQFQ